MVNLPLGAEPNNVDVNPEYNLLIPPVAIHPSFDCSRVLSVSNGNNTASTVIPATPPA